MGSFKNILHPFVALFALFFPSTIGELGGLIEAA
jgi:hypothetical protein